ncbi:interactor protein for cytohesin exchange factors 1 isoform X2 [Seriola aureovittata]|uniref:interactor protein for cytohesin exchange factors 1 isoform X2 n=1 Tax=Seriola aureovittata TaxID=2871759 RepID=UPI0024BE062F|nr:interactor protein for cytohesin exchange factors 1 isoform X2 [Seriola aureovittata]
MSVDATKLLFEGFLQKRKDTLKIRWVTYWFRLQNTTLFFYTKENGSAPYLRGYYYIYTVQSVREVQRAGSKRFMFEIIMTNGKRKMLAAETAALRKEWVGHLWQAMHLSTSQVSSRGRHLEECEQRDRLNSSTPICSHSDSVMESLPARPLSAPAPSVQIHCETTHLFQELNSEEETYQNTPSACNSQHQSVDGLNNPQWSGGLSNAENREGDYDVLPVRKKKCEINVLTEMDEGVYDFPLSYRRSVEQQDPAESIYDVPSNLLRNMPDHTIEEQHEEELYCRI